MTHYGFILITAIVLVLTFGLGWFTNGLVQRFARVEGEDVDEIDRLAQELHAAEEAREEALATLEAREDEMTSRITQLEAELRATMDGLRESRADAEDLRAYVEKLNAQG